MPKDHWLRARNRDIARRAKRFDTSRKRKRVKPPTLYVMAAGTNCYIRRAGEKSWKRYQTREEVRVQGHDWRNALWVRLSYRGYEIKVSALRLSEKTQGGNPCWC